jgi:rod shape-determining protein MreB and related proteins
MLNKRIGIDLGTANTLVWLEGRGVVLNEPTVVAIGVDDNQVLAVGNEAKLMLGRTPGNIQASRPMREGVIADYVITEAMLRYFIQKAVGKVMFFKPEVIICVPAGCTQVERRAVVDATLSAGARQAFLIDEPLAAAIGAGIQIEVPSGSMIVDIGGGATEAAVISLSGVVVHKSARVAGTKIDEAIVNFIRRKHNLYIGDQTAEEIKLKIGSAIALNKEERVEIKGRDSVLGMPKSFELTSTEVTEAIRPPLNLIVAAVKSVLEETPPELASDIIDKGIVLSGGSSQLRGFDRYLTAETGVPAHVAEDPLLCVVKGIGAILEGFDRYKRAISDR